MLSSQAVSWGQGVERWSPRGRISVSTWSARLGQAPAPGQEAWEERDGASGRGSHETLVTRDVVLRCPQHKAGEVWQPRARPSPVDQIQAADGVSVRRMTGCVPRTRPRGGDSNAGCHALSVYMKYLAVIRENVWSCSVRRELWSLSVAFIGSPVTGQVC